MGKFDFKKSASQMMSFIKKVETEIGPRLPGSDEERAAAVLIKQEYQKNIGVAPVGEKFKVAPRSGIGSIPYLGYAIFVDLLLLYLYPLAAIIGGALILLYAGLMVGFYTRIFDFLWKKEETENFYTVQEPASGKTDYTIILSAHYDSSWNWNHALKNPKTFILKIVYGVVGLVATMVGGAILTAGGGTNAPVWLNMVNNAASFGFWQWTSYILPALCIPGIYFVTQFLSYDKKIASPGCMDNLSGIGLNQEIARYFAENPDDMPKNCRIVTLACACEEAGLRGSLAFVKQHRGSDMLKNAYNINVDSISDDDYFEVIAGDACQFCRFDDELCDMAYKSMEETGVIKKTGRILNPAGGCDSTPFMRSGVPTVTIAAQNPIATNYYHTSNDKSDRLSEDVFAKAIEVVYRLIKKIEVKETAK